MQRHKWAITGTVVGVIVSGISAFILTQSPSILSIKEWLTVSIPLLILPICGFAFGKTFDD